jgi:hypothetical protein
LVPGARLRTSARRAPGCARKTEDAETRRRSQWVHDVAFREDAGRTYLLTTRDDVHFGDGWYPCERACPRLSRESTSGTLALLLPVAEERSA